MMTEKSTLVNFQENKAYHGLSLDLIRKLPDKSIHSVITSPPYWQLRDYGYSEQWGLEPTFEEYLENLWSLMDEIWRVLRDDGTVWINLSDTYARGTRKKDGVNNTIQTASKENHIEPSSKPNYKSLNKTLLMIPHRFAIGCLDRGWKVRNDIIWAIRNRKPESVKDRFSRKKEYIFLLTKQDKYYFDLDSVKDPLKTESIQRYMRGMSKKNKYANHDSTQTLNKPKKRITNQKERKAFENKMKNAGKNPGDVVSFWKEYEDVSVIDYLSYAYDYYVNGDVWDITNKGTKYKHFASYPTQLLEKPIKAGTPEGGIILDPFCGISTTGIMAIENNRKFIGFDGSKEYVNVSNERIREIIKKQKQRLF